MYTQDLSETKGTSIMKAWAEKRRQQVQACGATELARMFELVSRICDLEEQLSIVRNPRAHIRPESTMKAHSRMRPEFA